MPVLEWRDIISVAAIIFAAGGFYAGVRGNKRDLHEIKEDLKMLNKAVSEIAVQNNRLDNQDAMIAALQKQQVIQDARVYELSRGRGFIKKEIDGEYSS